MNISRIESLLDQEMLEVKGGRANICSCDTGARQSKDGNGVCKCKNAAQQIDTGTSSGPSGSDTVCQCDTGAIQTN
jgi:hypothetical protein